MEQPEIGLIEYRVQICGNLLSFEVSVVKNY